VNKKIKKHKTHASTDCDNIIMDSTVNIFGEGWNGGEKIDGERVEEFCKMVGSVIMRKL
jgi:hypothetical protein